MISTLIWTIVTIVVPSKHSKSDAYVHGSWFGVGDGTVVMWSLVWVLLPIILLVLLSFVWSVINGQFQNVQEIAERQLEIED